MSQDNMNKAGKVPKNSEDVDEEQLLNVLCIRLKQLDVEIRKEGITTAEYDKCKLVMNELLIFIDREYGTEVMVELIKILSIDIGHPLGPLSKSILKKLVKLG